ncbi:MAG: Ig-like domain-containing protein [Candidatus Heimdallarchaeota archaeon]
MNRKVVLTCLLIVLIPLSFTVGASQQVYATTRVSLNFLNPAGNRFEKNQPDTIHSSQNALWNDQVYFEWSNGSIVSWKVDDNGNKDPTDDVDLIVGNPMGNCIDLGWSDPEHTSDYNFYTTGTDTDRGHHSAATNVVSQIKTNETMGSVLITGELGPFTRFQIRYTLYIGDPAIYAQVAITWTQPTIIGFVGYGLYTSYLSIRDIPDFFILGNETEYRIDSLPFVSGWYLGINQEAQFAAFRNSNTGRIIGMVVQAENDPEHVFEVSGESSHPWGRGLSWFFKYRGNFSSLQPSYAAEFQIYSDNTNNYQAFLARTTKFPAKIPLSISFISPFEGESIQRTVRIQVKVNSNVVVSRVELFIEDVLSGWKDITSNYNPSTKYYYYEWDTSRVPNNKYTLIARVTDIAGNHGVKMLRLSINNLKLPFGVQGALVLSGLIATIFFVYQKRRESQQQRKLMIQAVAQRELEFDRTGRLNELINLAKDDILIFQDLAEKYAVSPIFIQRTVESLVSKGVLWGITTEDVFIGVKFAISTLKRLSKVYERITWQSLMEEFKLQSEKDLKVLLMQVSHSQNVVLKIDEIDKSVRILSVEEMKPVKKTPRTMVCPSCSISLDSRADHCENCGADFPKCIVCNLSIFDDYTKTPCCGSPAHSTHLKEWLKIKDECPICKEKLKEAWIL